MPVRARVTRVSAVSCAIIEIALKTAITDEPEQADAPGAEAVARLAARDLQRRCVTKSAVVKRPTVARPTPYAVASGCATAPVLETFQPVGEPEGAAAEHGTAGPAHARSGMICCVSVAGPGTGTP